MKQQFQERFNDFRSHKFEFDLFNKPFDIEVYDSHEDIQMELIELQANHELKLKFKSLKLIEFYESLSKSHSNAFPKVKTNALRIASMFGSIYLFEKLFSILKHKKWFHVFTAQDFTARDTTAQSHYRSSHYRSKYFKHSNF